MSRDRDWADVWRLTTEHDLDGSVMRKAFERTAAHREEKLRPLSPLVAELATRRQVPYAAWLRRQRGEAGGYPPDFTTVVQDVLGFADPILADQVTDHTWQSEMRTWRSGLG